MNIQLVTPAPLHLNNGNRITALRWAAILKKLGHRVKILQEYRSSRCDLLIALHARRSADSIRMFHDRQPNQPVIVVLTGTDVYRDIRADAQAQKSLELATRIVVLQKMALREVPRRFHAKTDVIYQSAEPYRAKISKPKDVFKVCIVAHLRNEKDPLRAAFAVRRLPPDSRIDITHIGRALESSFQLRANREVRHNPRYHWLGQLSHRETLAQIAASHLVCITSRIEGSSNVLSEALASGVPVITSNIPGLVGTLGQKFSGFFKVGDTQSLRIALLRAEREIQFYNKLKKQCSQVSALVKPHREMATWRRVLSKAVRAIAP